MTLGEFVSLQRGHDLPQGRRRPGKIPILGSFGITGWHDMSKATGPGVTVGRSGASFGVVSYSEVDFWPLNTALYVTDFHGNYQRFAYYFLKHFDFRRFNSGSAQPSLNRNFVHPSPVVVPPLPEQLAIAQILGSLDDKIELNRRMNETLERIARAIFKSWFVDFDPVRAKMEGHRSTGIDADTGPLFPESLVDSEIGPIPEAWTVGKIGDVAENLKRQVNPSELEEAVAYIGLEHMPRRRIALSDWATSEGLVSNKFEFSQGEILFGKLRPYFHKVGVAPVDGVCSTDILVVGARETGWGSFVLGHLSSDELVAHADATSSGTRMPRTNWKDLSSYGLALPPSNVMTSFDAIVSPLVEAIIGRIHESRALVTIRDTLVPKLISGEIRIKDAEKLVEARL